MVAPTINSPVCQEQLIETGKLVAKSVEGCVEASQGATSDEQLLKQVGVAATGVTQALNELLQHIRQYASGGQPIGRHGEATDRILDVTDNIFSSMGDAGTRNAFNLFAFFISAPNVVAKFRHMYLIGLWKDGKA